MRARAPMRTPSAETTIARSGKRVDVDQHWRPFDAVFHQVEKVRPAGDVRAAAHATGRSDGLGHARRAREYERIHADATSKTASTMRG